MARYSSGRWSRPATGRQIAALKAHGNYDGKYYSMGRASQSIGKSVANGSSRTYGAGRSMSYSRVYSTAPSEESLRPLVADLLGIPATMDALLGQALDHVSEPPSGMTDPVESVVFTLAADETDLRNPRIQVDAVVSRNPNYSGDIEMGVQFASNVEFGQAPLIPPLAGFKSGVVFDD